MSTRNRLPNRRPAENFDLEVGGLRYTATVGRFPDGSIGELFLNNHKSNSSADTAARDSAIVLSIATKIPLSGSFDAKWLARRQRRQLSATE